MVKTYYLNKSKEEVKEDRMTSNIENVFEYYFSSGFDLVEVCKDGKIPIEADWTKQSHKDKREWYNWINKGSNIGLKTGKLSKIIILDLDSKKIPKDIEEHLRGYIGFLQETSSGYHYAFQYDEEIPKTYFELEGCHVDVESEGGQVVVYPSKILGVERKILSCAKIPKMPQGLKDYLIKKIGPRKPVNTVLDEEIKLAISQENIEFIKEGNRNVFMMKFGGIIRKKRNLEDTQEILGLVNKCFIKPPLDYNDFKHCIRSIEKYTFVDEKEMASKILDYMNLVPDHEATERDIREALRLPKKDIEKVLAYLMTNEYVIKKRRMYYLIQKANWKEAFLESGKTISFKFPYFDDTAVFRNSDMIVIGGKTGAGKTHVAMNIIKRLVRQGIKPNYVSLESGNRFATIAQQLGLKEGDFKWDVHYNPEHVELEKNTVTLIDWLLPKDYANTDKLYEYFSQQLRKNGGILIVFVQLRNTGEFFAPDMIGFFPSFVAKFFYENDEDRTRSYFIPVKVRENKMQNWSRKISLVYDWTTKELNRVDEVQVNNPEPAQAM